MGRYKILFLFPLLLFSCKKTVTLKLPVEGPQLFIEGVITDQGGPYTVMINRSVSFYAANDFPPVSGASVRISDNNGSTDSLTETSPGVYTTHSIQGTPGYTYTLSVTVNDTTYTAQSTMPQPVAPSYLSFSIVSVLNQQRITPTVYFMDPFGIKNYYRFEMWVNGTAFNKEIFVFDDRLSDGREINLDLQMDSSYLRPYDIIQVYMDNIDKNVYNYFNQLSQSNGNNAFNAEVSPGNPVSNISNGAYGYFSAQSVGLITQAIP